MSSQVWNEETWATIDKLVQDVNWKRECLNREEKFDMYFSASVSPCAVLHISCFIIKHRNAVSLHYNWPGGGWSVVIVV
jgi:hypothetical protein